MKTLAFDRIGPCFVLAVGSRSPSDTDWDAYLDFVKESIGARKAPLTLVSSKGGGPTPAQRQRLNDVTKSLNVEKTLKVAVLTQSPVVRGIATALSWFVQGYKAFAPSDLGAALDFLGVISADQIEIKRLVPKLHARIDDPK
jgi:hypothetical protein